jgi:hypothetical protein
MDDLDQLLAETMRAAAVHAPPDADLLGMVHRRSAKYRRRRIVTGLAAMLVLIVPTAVVFVARPRPPAPQPEAPHVIAAGAVTLVAGYTAPTFPYTFTSIDGLKAPVASMDGGNLIAFFEATEQKRHADITVAVSNRRPTFDGPAAETSMWVRGHRGTLRTVDVAPAKQLTLYWPESSTRWIRIATDDTYTADQVVALADALTAASIPVLPPFALDLSPARLVTDAVTASTMNFRMPTSPPGTNGLTTVLRTRRQLTATNATVGTYPALLTHGAGGVTLDVDVTDWDATLEVTVSAALAMTDSDLLRFAAGIHILDRSNPR